MSQHKWVGKKRGGDPADAGSYEYVRYCDKCGMEDQGEDAPMPACEVSDEEYAAREKEPL